ncbi:hypothetical protein V3C99_007423 [Haemonchus contortus]|uniref:C-type lectin domain-containing protein n=1 Tax=Haemonchus contortus TaxID=6289 RepID=A0A7I4YR36_HAECO
MWSKGVGKSSVKILLVTIVLVEASTRIDPCSPWVVNFRTMKCYRVFCVPQTQQEAEAVCRIYGGHLATICNQDVDDFAALMGYFYQTGRDLPRVWIGLHWKGRDPLSWIWESGSNCTYRAWWQGQNTPDNYGGTEKCVHYITFLSSAWNMWNDLHCHNKENFICETDDCTQL